uniref:Cationic amino acid transporter C-terminal domain-containing protein n=3 Tax=Chrysotila carterae TaxID=13221 RepID=A0A7S4F166_CHRCT
MVAAEVVSPARAFPLSLCGALLLSTLLYVAPLAAAVATVGGWEDWKAGQFVDISAQIGGPYLSAALAAAGVVSMCGVMCTLLCTTSRAIAAMATLRMLPAGLSKLHPRFGTPAAAIVCNSAAVAVATSTLQFESLLGLSMLFYAVNVLMQCAALLKLRVTHAHLPSPSCALPSPLLLFPCALALAVLALAPRSQLLSAATLGVGTLALYSLLSLCRAADFTGTKRAQVDAAQDTAADSTCGGGSSHIHALRSGDHSSIWWRGSLDGGSGGDGGRAASGATSRRSSLTMAERLNGAWRRKFASGKYVQIPKAAAAAEMVQAFELSTLEAEVNGAERSDLPVLS